ncbi:MAG: hypothetical protein AB1512_03010 [Thermodesulfobacteriota bacterium]
MRNLVRREVHFRIASVAFISLLSMFLLSGCASLYKKPITQYKEGVRDLGSIYLQHVDSFNSAQEDRKRINLLTVLKVPDQKFTSVRARFQGTSETFLPGEHIEIRKEAFHVLDNYLSVLEAIAAGEDIDKMSLEVKGLGDDFSRLGKALGKIPSISMPSEATQIFDKLPGYFQIAGAALKMIDSMYRSVLLRRTIEATQEPVRNLLVFLKNETAVLFSQNLKFYCINTRLLRKDFIEDPQGVENQAIFYPVYELHRKYEAITSQYSDAYRAYILTGDCLRMQKDCPKCHDVGNPAEVFDKALAAYDALAKSLLKVDIKVLIASVKEFSGVAKELKEGWKRVQ